MEPMTMFGTAAGVAVGKKLFRNALGPSRRQPSREQRGNLTKSIAKKVAVAAVATSLGVTLPDA